MEVKDYKDLHTGDVILFNGMKLVVIGLHTGSFYNVECLGAAEENKIKILDGICNIGIRWGLHTSVEVLGHVSFVELIDIAIRTTNEQIVRR